MSLNALEILINLSSNIFTPDFKEKPRRDEKVLKRGFAIIKDSNFSLIRSSKDVKNNQSLNIQFRDNDFLTVKANLKEKE